MDSFDKDSDERDDSTSMTCAALTKQPDSLDSFLSSIAPTKIPT